MNIIIFTIVGIECVVLIVTNIINLFLLLQGGAVNLTIDQDEGNDIPLTSDIQETPSTEYTTKHDISYTQCKQMKRKVNNF